ncbi:aminopeptidase P family protein, partial [candidate division KSB1 bacterium]|nr:aminopeptidase P family protein [candidate division KSB1 bacterium]
SIGQEDHGKGANIDGYETVDLRELVPGLLFSIEPGIYLPQFGVRTEIDVYYGANGPEVFAPMQKELVLLDV